MKNFGRRAIVCVASALAFTVAVAAGISINTSSLPWSKVSNVAGTDNGTDEAIQSAALSQITQIYAAMYPGTMKAGTIYTIIWQDGTSESVLVSVVDSTAGSDPIPGTQKDKDGNPQGGSVGGGGSGAGGGGGSGGTIPPVKECDPDMYDCGTVTVGPTQTA